MTPQEREACELERDSRTVFSFNLPLKADEDDIAAFFSKAGKVRDIRLITDRNSRRSKGFAYVEFFDRDAVPAALSLSGTQMMGQTIQVQQSQAEKNRLAQANSSMTTTTIGPTRIYVGSMHVNTDEDTLRRIFSRFGDIQNINIHYDPETGRSKGFGFIQYRRPDEAKRAVQQGNGMEIDGNVVKVNFVNESKQIGSHDLDDDEGGLTLNAQSRVLLMEKLQRSELEARKAEQAKLQQQAQAAQMAAAPPVPPSPTVLLTNMFDPAEYASFLSLLKFLQGNRTELG